MTVAAQTPTISYSGDGSTTAFAAPFRYDAPTDLRALVRKVNGSETVLAYTTDYTASAGAGDAGGTVTLTTAPASGETVVIWRETARVQPTDYIESGAFTAESHESALDRSVLIGQELDTLLARAPKVPRGELAPPMESLVTRAGRIARFDSAGNFASLTLAELAVLLSPEKLAGTTLAYVELVGPRSQVVVFHPDGIGAGGYWVEVSAQADTAFVRAYARVLGGGGTCDVQVLGGGVELWAQEGVSGTATDETITKTLSEGDDLIVVIDNIVGDVTGVIVKLEGAAS